MKLLRRVLLSPKSPRFKGVMSVFIARKYSLTRRVKEHYKDGSCRVLKKMRITESQYSEVIKKGEV